MGEQIAASQIVSVAEGTELQKRLKAAATGKQWHWMGNYGDVFGPVNVANQSGVAAGEMIININFANGLVAAWMYF